VVNAGRGSARGGGGGGGLALDPPAQWGRPVHTFYNPVALVALHEHTRHLIVHAVRGW
jgi:hypothetical protein